MKKYTILCVDDERQVLDALLSDLSEFEKNGFRIEAASSVLEAREVVKETEPGSLALVLCDHLMPGVVGVDFLVELSKNPDTLRTRKVLVTGQAGLSDTIRAVNQAGLDHYVEKPWTKPGLVAVVIAQLTNYVLDVDENPQQYARFLDYPRIMEAIRERQF